MEHRPIQLRSNLVCVACHERKVKCNLQESLDNGCRNCRRSNQVCIPRDRLRKRRKPHGLQHRALEPAAAAVPTPTPTPPTTTSTPAQGPNNDDPGEHVSYLLGELPPRPDAFISRSVVMAYDANRENIGRVEALHPLPRVREAVLKATEADVLPRPTLRQALVDAFFEHVCHFCPVVDAADLAGPEPSLLLQQTVCLAGSLVRHDRESINMTLSLYEKVKTLIFLNVESDKLALLKALCILPFYSVLRTDHVTLDGPWHWVGMAIRTAIQMGLHKEATCTDPAKIGSHRRIFWYLVQADNMSVVCWGRPSALALNDCEVRPLTLHDFNMPSLQATAFIYLQRLQCIIGKIAHLHMRQAVPPAEDILAITEALGNWVHTLPKELQLYNPDGSRQPFCRPALELMIVYFAHVVLLQMLDVTTSQKRVSIPSLAASLCIVRLYEEIECREHTAHLLPVHGLTCMIAAVPLIYYRPQGRERESQRVTEISIICSILTRLRDKYGGSDLVLSKIQRLQRMVDNDKERRFQQGPWYGNTDMMEEPSQDALDRIHELLPFPTSFCSGMELLKRRNNTDNNNVVPSEFMCLDDTFADMSSDFVFPLMDTLGMDLTTFDSLPDANPVD